MINKEDYTLSFGFIERTEEGMTHFHFRIEGPHDEDLFFYTFKDLSGYKCDHLSDPFDYILFGALLLLLKGEIEEEMRQHYKDGISPLLDHMKKEPKRERKGAKETKKRKWNMKD